MEPRGVAREGPHVRWTRPAPLLVLETKRNDGKSARASSSVQLQILFACHD